MTQMRVEKCRATPGPRAVTGYAANVLASEWVREWLSQWASKWVSGWNERERVMKWASECMLNVTAWSIFFCREKSLYLALATSNALSLPWLRSTHGQWSNRLTPRSAIVWLSLSDCWWERPRVWFWSGDKGSPGWRICRFSQIFLFLPICHHGRMTVYYVYVYSIII